VPHICPINGKIAACFDKCCIYIAYGTKVAINAAKMAICAVEVATGNADLL
jgi:hypothetical protein